MISNFLLSGLIALGAGSSVSAAEIHLRLTGTELEGGPSFQVLIDERVVGEGVVDPIPPSGEYSDYSFQVPDGELASSSALSVRLTNDMYREGVGDRNLIIGSATVADVELARSDFQILRNGEVRNGSDGFLGRNSDVAIAKAPSTGWLGSGPSVPAEAVGTECEPLTVAVTGFSNGTFAINESQKAGLSALATETSCQITVTGYSSVVGAEQTNRVIATRRAESVADYLVSVGISRDRMRVVGEGETEQFGSTHGDNRRVVVSASPRT